MGKLLTFQKLNRRGFLGLFGALAAPAIVHAELIMPVKPVIIPPAKVLLPDQCVWVPAILENAYQMVRPIDPAIEEPTGMRALVTNRQLAEGWVMQARALAWDTADAAVSYYGKVMDRPEWRDEIISFRRGQPFGQ